jgi:hypothetical protein
VRELLLMGAIDPTICVNSTVPAAKLNQFGEELIPSTHGSRNLLLQRLMSSAQ